MENLHADINDDRRRDLLRAVLAEAAFEGWTDATLKMAAQYAAFSSKELARGDLELLFPKGVADVLAFWAMEEDAAMEQAFAALDPAPEKIREKVTWLVRQRIEQLEPHKEAARRAAATLALPQYASLGTRLTWATAGSVWRALGDQSTDANWYSKRATLSAVYASTLLRWFAEEDEDMSGEYPATWAFLDERISNVMQIEKWKAKLRQTPFDPAGVASFLGRVRYGAQRS